MSIYEDLLTLPGVDRQVAMGLISQAVEEECATHKPRSVNITAIASLLTAVAILGPIDNPREVVADGAVRMRILRSMRVEPTTGG